MKKFKEARGKGRTVYFSKAQPDKLFVNGKFIPANAPLTDFVYVRAPLSHMSRDKNVHVNIILSSELFFHSALK